MGAKVTPLVGQHMVRNEPELNRRIAIGQEVDVEIIAGDAIDVKTSVMVQIYCQFQEQVYVFGVVNHHGMPIRIDETDDEFPGLV